MHTSAGTAGKGRCRRRSQPGLYRYLAAALLAPALLLWAAASSADTRARVDALMLSVPFRGEAAWHDDFLAAMRPLSMNDEVFVPVPRLLEALRDPDIATRRGAARTLGEIGQRWGWPESPETLRSALIAALQDRDGQVREGAVRALGRIRPIQSVEPALTIALDDPEPRVRWAATHALTGWNRSNWIADSLASALSDPDPRVRLGATYAMQRFEAGVGQAMPVLVDRLRSGGPEARLAAAEQLQFFWHAAFPDGRFAKGPGEEAIRLFAAMLDDTEGRIRQLGAGSINRIVFIAGQSSAGERDLRDIAGQSSFGPDGTETVSLIARLAAALADHEPAVRTTTAWALRSLGRTATPALDALETALERETDADARWAMRMAREVIANRLDRDEARTALVPRSSWYDRRLCLFHEDAALAGLRAGDSERKVADLLGEPGRVTAGESEDDGGSYIVYTYHYPGLEVDIARGSVERLSTNSPAMPTGRFLHTGLTRQEVLALFGTPATAEARTARQFSGPVCDTDHYDTMYMTLTFDEAGVLDRIEWVMQGP